MMNTPPSSSYPLEDIPEDTPVYDVNGDKVGNISFSAMRDGYVVIEKGVIFTQELFIPVTAIQTREANEVRLLLSKNELKNDRWKQPPTGMSGASAQGTVPSSSSSEDVIPPTPSAQGEDMDWPPAGSQPPLATS